MAITVEIVGKRIELRGWDGPDTSARCKQIVGARARWNRRPDGDKFDCWTYPIDYTVCLQFRQQFGDALVIGPALSKWARSAKQKREKLNTTLSAAEFDLPRVTGLAPQLAAAMSARKYQQVGAAFLTQARRALMADEPGLGKTLQVMAAAVQDDVKGEILVLAPSQAVQITWPDELRRWLPEDRFYPAVGDRAKRTRVIEAFKAGLEAEPDRRHWLICNYEMARANTKLTKLTPEPGPFKWSSVDKKTKKTINGNWHHPYADLFRIGWKMIVADESHKALVASTSVKVNQSQTRAGLGMLRIADENGLRIPMSGTPFKGKLYKLWGTLNWMRPDHYTSYWNWVNRFFETFDDGYSTTIGKLRPEMEAAFYAELDTLMIRRKKREVVPELPPKEYPGRPLDSDEPGSLHGIWLEMSPKQAKFYGEMVKNAEAKLDSGTLMAVGGLAELTRLKQFAICAGDIEIGEKYDADLDMMVPDLKYIPGFPSNKFDWLWEWLVERGIAPDEDGEYGDADTKVVIASQFTQIINLYAAELERRGVPVHVLTGETSAGRRRKAKEAFQSDGGPRVFLLNTEAGGVSLTLDAADDLIFLDEKWVPDDQTQVEDRIHRVSRMHQVRIWYVRSLGTIEEQIGRNNEESDMIQLHVLDGRRGVEYARKLIGMKV